MTNIKAKQISEVAIGDIFKVADIEFIKFTEENGIVQAVARSPMLHTEFDDQTSNFAQSSLLHRLETEILPRIEAAVGSENVLEFTTDLISLDGLDDYGTMKSKISLPTFDFYRKHVRIFDTHKVYCWWWLSTPESVPTHDLNCYVSCVDQYRKLVGSWCQSKCGVRPIVNFVSSIFVQN